MTSILFYYNILQLYFGVAIAVFIAAQPLLILITSAAHAVEVQARNRGWSRVNSAAYWVAKVCGTLSAVDMRNVQRVGGKVFEILMQIISAWPTSKAAKTLSKSVSKTGASLVLIAGLASLPMANGCALLKTAGFWDTAKEVCVVALTARDDVKTEAKARGLTGQEWASVLCNLSDVIEQFVIDDSDPKAAGERAMSAAKARGLQR